MEIVVKSFENIIENVAFNDKNYIDKPHDHTLNVTLVGEGSKRDLFGAESGHGGYGCPEGVPVELALLSILAAFGVAFGILYRALTLTTGKRKRSNSDLGFWFTFADVLWIGKKIFISKKSLYFLTFENGN